jgi:hemoglobin
MTIPTLYDWIGGIDALSRLTEAFYQRVRTDDLLGPVFARMDPYSEAHGGHPEMVRHHLNHQLSEPMRRRWINLLLDTYTDLGLPADPEFASALVGYLEWGSRLAVINSQPGAKVFEHAPMPQWGWGEVKGPYLPKGS